MQRFKGIIGFVATLLLIKYVYNKFKNYTFRIVFYSMLLNLTGFLSYYGFKLYSDKVLINVEIEDKGRMKFSFLLGSIIMWIILFSWVLLLIMWGVNNG